MRRNENKEPQRWKVEEKLRDGRYEEQARVGGTLA